MNSIEEPEEEPYVPLGQVPKVEINAVLRRIMQRLDPQLEAADFQSSI